VDLRGMIGLAIDRPGPTWPTLDDLLADLVAWGAGSI